MKNIKLIIFLIGAVCLLGKTYCQSDTLSNTDRVVLQKVEEREDRRIRMVIPEEKYLDSIKTLKAEGYTIDSQLYDRKNKVWEVFVFPPTQKSKNFATDAVENKLSFSDGTRYARTGKNGDILLEDTFKDGKLVQRKVNGKIVLKSD
ncbi:MAG: hypothetical protein IJ759_07825 [Bacteroidales bacterium]|nr:hypothetical protein [Bacteroidales bacterium]